MYKDYVCKLKALLMIDYMLSDEPERIIDPEIDEGKYELFLGVIQKCVEYAERYHLKLDVDDPEFPKCSHMLSLIFPTQDELLEININDMYLFNIIGCSDGVIMGTDKSGNIQIDMFFNDIYKEKGGK